MFIYKYCVFKIDQMPDGIRKPLPKRAEGGEFMEWKLLICIFIVSAVGSCLGDAIYDFIKTRKKPQKAPKEKNE